MEESDETIALKVLKGDTESFGILVERYEKKIGRYARKFLSDSEEISDLVQEVFVSSYVNIRSFDPSRKFSPWLYRIAHNEFVNYLRKKSRRSFLSLDFLDTDAFFPHPRAEETADNEANRREMSEAIKRNLGKLDPKYREPLVLSYFEELSYQEIADVLHIPISTVGVRLSRGKNLLKKLYENEYGK